MQNYFKSQTFICLFFVLFPCDLGDPVSSVRVRGPIHLHLPHTWRTPDLFALQLLQIFSIRWWNACEFMTVHSCIFLKMNGSCPYTVWCLGFSAVLNVYFKCLYKMYCTLCPLHSEFIWTSKLASMRITMQRSLRKTS